MGRYSWLDIIHGGTEETGKLRFYGINSAYSMETNSYNQVGMADSTKSIEKRGSVLDIWALAEPAIVSTVAYTGALWHNGWVVM